MIKDIGTFNKNKSLAEIKEWLNNKYKVDLSYQCVYREFRKMFPLTQLTLLHGARRIIIL